MVSDPRAQALRALATFLVTDVTLGETLHRVAEVATDGIKGAEVAGIAMLDASGRATTAVYTDEESPQVDQAQYESGRGPCLDAWRQARTVRIDDMTMAADHYPEFARASLDHGIESTLSLGLVAGGKGVGALNLYARTTYAFTEADEELGEEIAAAAGAVLTNAHAYWSAFELSEGLREAMNSRAVIEQAKGILMAGSPTLDPDGAFDVLRRASQRENLKLREIAQRIVQRRPPPPPVGV
ncbi:MAG: GAF and ANTAR domain-containing protein [Actinomycetota bacterium]|nr:GAF and ANTAR domain-containing protein [Actinomycetota bacterium]